MAACASFLETDRDGAGFEACCKISKLVDMNLKTKTANTATGNAEIILGNLSYVFVIIIAIAYENKECVFATN